MFTIFHFIAFVACAFGGVQGGMFGWRHYGIAGLVGGAFLGLCLGWVVGNLPGFLSTRWLLWRLGRQSSEELRDIIRSRQYYIYHLAFANLMARGEDIQAERSFVLELLVSEMFGQRLCGWRTLQLAFPEVAAQIPNYDPGAATDVCRSMVGELKL